MIKKDKVILVSSCLIGRPCAYDGKDRLNTNITLLCKKHGYVDICPETAGGLSCPRERHEIVGGTGLDVIEGKAGVAGAGRMDHTLEFMSGAKETLKLCTENNIDIAVMKSKSPSCGKYKIHDGQFCGMLIKGSGVTVALLQKNGIKVFTENETKQAEKEIQKHKTL